MVGILAGNFKTMSNDGVYFGFNENRIKGMCPVINYWGWWRNRVSTLPHYSVWRLCWKLLFLCHILVLTRNGTKKKQKKDVFVLCFHHYMICIRNIKRVFFKDVFVSCFHHYVICVINIKRFFFFFLTNLFN